MSKMTEQFGARFRSTDNNFSGTRTMTTCSDAFESARALSDLHTHAHKLTDTIYTVIARLNAESFCPFNVGLHLTFQRQNNIDREKAQVF